MEQAENIKQFWDQQAKDHGPSDTATAPDSAYRQLEIDRIKSYIVGPRVLDAGCGNGYSTLKFKETYPDFHFVGVDYSEKMIRAARKESINHQAAFIVSDVRALSCDLGLDRPYNTIISERCLINLQNWEEQKAALGEMRKCLAPGGRIILVENFMEGLNNLNQLREELALEPIEERWHNRYMRLEELEALDDLTIVHRENIGNLYYIISRVVYASFAKLMGEEVKYNHPLNYIASKLPSLGKYNYSPNMLYVLEHRA